MSSLLAPHPDSTSFEIVMFDESNEADTRARLVASVVAQPGLLPHHVVEYLALTKGESDDALRPIVAELRAVGVAAGWDLPMPSMDHVHASVAAALLDAALCRANGAGQSRGFNTLYGERRSLHAASMMLA